VSTAEQAGDGSSLEAQEARIRAWVMAAGAELVDVVVDAGVSGSKPLADRPGGRRIAKLFDARQPEADAVVVLRLDRLGRDAAEQMALLKKFRSGSVGLVAVAQGVDLASPHGRAMAQIAAVFGELERALIAERTTEVLAELRRQGRVFGHPPFGYDAVDGRLVRNVGEQATLDRIKRLRTAGLGYDAVARRLNEQHRPAKNGGQWFAMSVRSVVLTSQRMENEAP
jgi:DNA invertase Pin-like site-specific DNA recombinase